LLDAMGDYAAAEPYFQQCLEMDLRVLGESHPDTAKSLDNLSGLESAVGRWTEAAAHRDAARRIVRRHIARVLPGLSEKEQLAFLQNHVERSYHASLSLGLANRDNQTIRAQSASWLLNGKAVAQESLAERARLALESLDPQTAEVVKDLQVVRRQLATLGLAAPRPGQEAARKAQLAELESQEQALSRRLATATGERVAEEPWIELDAVRSALPADGVLVDIARFTMRNFAAKPGEPNFGPARYAAWIIPPAGKGDVQLVDLGPADQIDAAVAAAQGAMQAAMGHGDMPGLIQSLGEQAAEQAVLEALRQLSQLALAPIVAEAGDAKQWIVSPDAALWLVPWGALPLADGRYAVEAYKIRYLISGRDLVARRGGEVTTSKPAIMADPNYDLGPADSLAATRAVLRGVVLPSDDQLRRLSSESSAMPKVARLPGTAAEAKAIESQLASYAHQSPNLYTDIYALEAVFKALRRPKALVLATHGFFLPDQQADGNDKGAEAGQAGQARGDLLSVDGKPIENPLLRCGLLLAGCNARSKLAGLEDGVLTGMEIVGADLHGTELVVLSACETGLGKVRNGEGVAGLRQAFQMAGARAVVATLWQVPDRQSSQLMTNFFANLAAGQSKVDALRNAQLALIEARREKHAAAHPFFWAAFTLTGE
jgi:CHAT domain-containing protein